MTQALLTAKSPSISAQLVVVLRDFVMRFNNKVLDDVSPVRERIMDNLRADLVTTKAARLQEHFRSLQAIPTCRNLKGGTHGEV